MPNPKDETWWAVENMDEIPSPALLVYAERLEANLQAMIRIARSPDRLRPHLKTCKMGEVVRLLLRYGIRKCKCATVAEAEMAAQNGAEDILLAMQPVGPQVERFIALQRKFPGRTFSTIADSEAVLRAISAASLASGLETGVFLDIDNGMHRTGIAPGPEALHLYRRIHQLPALKAAGLHVYDGHIRESCPDRRAEICNRDYEPVAQFIEQLHRAGMEIPILVAGGTPTFPIHAGRKDVELSPGTTLLWDDGYGRSFPDLGLSVAALVLSRIVSKPGLDLLCLDLGHKAVASEMPHPRVKLIGIDSPRFVSHSEEHLVIAFAEAHARNIGDPVYGIPTHICPTVARYDSAYIIRNRRAVEQWKIEAQNRIITV